MVSNFADAMEEDVQQLAFRSSENSHNSGLNEEDQDGCERYLRSAASPFSRESHFQEEDLDIRIQNKEITKEYFLKQFSELPNELRQEILRFDLICFIKLAKMIKEVRKRLTILSLVSHNFKNLIDNLKQDERALYDDKHWHRLLDAEAYVNSCSDRASYELSELALKISIDENIIQRLKYLLSGGANVNVKDHYNCPLLTRIISFGSYPVGSNSNEGCSKIVALFIAYGVDVNLKNRSKVTPLMCAAFHGYPEIIRMLLSANANVNEIDCIGETALSKASLRGWKEIIILLLEANANDNSKKLH